MTARVTTVTFYGSDAVVGLDLAGTTQVTARVPGHRSPAAR